jgi:hypothetical protein
MMTDIATVEEAVDHYWYTFYKNYTDPKLRASPQKQNGRVAKRNKLSTDDVSSDIDNSPTEQTQIREVIEARRNYLNQFETQDVLNIDQILKRQLGNDAQAERLSKIYVQAIEILRDNPFPSKGVQSVAHQKANHIIIDGKREKIYRANPTQMPGIKAPKELQHGRIIYSVNKNNLIIIGLFAGHDEYMKFIATLS